MLKTAVSDNKKGAGRSHVMAIQNKPTIKRKGNSWKKKGKAKDKILWHPRLVQLPMLNVFIVRKLVIEKETASRT
jgi:hypothetical protein